jgi:formylglycine-generating enzyme required for sulfatase activity
MLSLRRRSLLVLAGLGLATSGCPGPMPDYHLGAGGAASTTSHGGSGTGTVGHGGSGTGTGGTGGHGGTVTTGTGGHGGTVTTATGGHGGAGASGGTGGAGGAVVCNPECAPPAVPECEAVACTAGQCVSTFQADGKAIAAQVAGDCHVVVCDGKGGTKQQIDDADADDGVDCTNDACDAGVATHAPSAPEQACAQSGGKVCDGKGACVACVSTPDCADSNKVCDANVCVTLACKNGSQDGQETDTDCGGGACAPCGDGKKCGGGADCASHVCDASSHCAAPGCGDGAKNGDETDVDCGGSCPGDCGPGKGCATSGDCVGGDCNGSTCVPNCLDQAKTGSETDVDCGGGACSPCAEGAACKAGGDCQSGGCCNAPSGTCSACCDGAKDGSETDVDCGGSCAKCPQGKACGAPGDCATGFCVEGVCCDGACVGTCSACSAAKTGGVAGTCAAVKAGTDPDDECALGGGAEACGTGGKCQCGDGVKDGAETDVDCGGGVCAKCGDGKLCAAAADCVSGGCDGSPSKCGPPVTGPSCAGGLDCGGVSCCEARAVPGGTFKMGRSAVNGDPDYFPAGEANEIPEHPATVADFRLDTFEVTVGRFRKFVEQYDGTPPSVGAGAHPLIPGSGWQAAWNGKLAQSQAALVANLKCGATKETWTDSANAGRETYPISCVSWHDLLAFCIWDGGRLPTEAEWEYAAAGGSDNRLYPWGSAPPDNAHAVFECQWGGTPGVCDFQDVAPVGSAPTGNGRWGHRDLAGNMWEWAFDFWDPSWYSGGGSSCTNCANLNPTQSRLQIGGGWNYAATYLRAAARGGNGPDSRGGVGGRCARGLPATCNDKQKDGTETDVDCGGASCVPCADTKACLVASDCASGVCIAGVCGTPSCTGGLDCGGVSCCESQLVPGGTFPMGRGNASDAYVGGDVDEQPEHNATVADFRLDTFEITVGRFRKFVSQYNGTPPAVGAGAHPLIPGSGWQAAWNGSVAASQAALIGNLKCGSEQTWTDLAGANENLPMNCVDWYEAFAFCVWDGGRLTTEAEWEYSAAGGGENRLYPWGSAAPDVTLAVFNCAFGGTPGNCTLADIAPVGSTLAGNGRWGHRDLAGSMWEWGLDWHDAAWYTGQGAVCANCANLNAASARIVRGGSWLDLNPKYVRAVDRGADPAAFRFSNSGVRCARNLPASCTDKAKNGAETDVDCGGVACGKCADTKSCLVASDCATGVCVGGKCGAPSCAGGLDCGGVSCCESLAVPGGTFPMGRSASGSDAYAVGVAASEQPEHNATVADLRLDTFEVTVGRFRKFVSQYDGTPPAVGAGAHPLIPGSGWQAAWNGSLPGSAAALKSSLAQCAPKSTWTDAPAANEATPINCVTWFDAFAFCAWDGGRLPTEAEWEYASAGGSDNRLFPWGLSDPSVTKALANDSYSDNSPFTVVGSHPSGNGKWGHRDLAGSVNEWNLDWMNFGWYGGAGAVCSNCASLSPQSNRVVRGGAWSGASSDLRAATRGNSVPSTRWNYNGLRCARSAQ